MSKASDAVSDDDAFNLRRFTRAQAGVYDTALAELRRGQKRTHWMWFIFPQIEGLGYSQTSKDFAIRSIEEARHYLQHPVLGPRLRECAEAVLSIEGRSVSDIFGFPDNLKLKSSMTLFSHVATPGSVFVTVLDEYFNGEMDGKTLHILAQLVKTTRQEQAS